MPEMRVLCYGAGVRPSVLLLAICNRSGTLELLEGFKRNLAQVYST